MGGHTFEREKQQLIQKRGLAYFRGWAYFQEVIVHALVAILFGKHTSWSLYNASIKLIVWPLLQQYILY